MDFIDKINDLSARVARLKDTLQTEEATKTALVMPFLQAMDYDVFDPHEVLPEFTADVGMKKGEKVDYAILQDGKPIMLIECKQCGCDLEKAPSSQLYRYFNVAEARIAILTDGIRYLFFTDLDEPNKMDAKPFLELNLSEVDPALVEEVKKLTKNRFDLEATLSTAVELKYAREVRRVLAEEIDSPSDELVRFFASRAYDGRLTPAVKSQFKDIVRKAMRKFVDDRISERLKSALSMDSAPAVQAAPMIEEAAPEEESRIVTTPEEMEGFYIVKSILREACDVCRVAHRDAKSYFGILLDDNNRKPICRLHFNGAQKYIGLFDENRREERVPVSSLNDIFKHAERLKGTVGNYLQKDKS